MPVVISTESFLKGLAAAKVMAYPGSDDPTYAAVVLATARVETGEVGTQNSLVFVASDGASPGQVIFAADGDLPAVKLSIGQAAQLMNAAKGSASASQKLGKEAEFTVELSVVDEGSALLMRTLTDGFPGESDSRHYVPLQDVTKFPLASTLSRLDARGPSEVLGVSSVDEAQSSIPLKVGNLQSFTGDVLKKMGAIAAVFKEPIEQYTRNHPAGLITVTCAGVFRAVLYAHAYSADVDVDDPEVLVAHSLVEALSAGADGDVDLAATSGVLSAPDAAAVA